MTHHQLAASRHRVRRRIMIVGGLSIDTITEQDGSAHLAIPGGNAVYAAIGALVWGISPVIVGVIGDDYPEAWLRAISDAGIDARSIQRVSGPHQGHFAVRYAADGSREPYVPVEAFAAAGT